MNAAKRPRVKYVKQSEYPWYVTFLFEVLKVGGVPGVVLLVLVYGAYDILAPIGKKHIEYLDEQKIQSKLQTNILDTIQKELEVQNMLGAENSKNNSIQIDKLETIDNTLKDSVQGRTQEYKKLLETLEALRK